jgi:hypothetical protein
MLNGGPGRGAARLAVALDGTANPVRTATPDRSLGDGIQPDQEQTIMNTSHQGAQPENCPAFIARATLEKRVRRALAKQGRKLLKSRAGTPALREHGRYAVVDAGGAVIKTRMDLATLARELGVMTNEEYLDPRSDWRYFVARQHQKVIDGRVVLFNDRVSRNFLTMEQAEAHALEMGGPLGIVGFDVGRALGWVGATSEYLVAGPFPTREEARAVRERIQEGRTDG